MTWEYVAIALLSLGIFISMAGYYGARREARGLAEALALEIRANSSLREQVDGLLKTRRRATRERVLGVIEGTGADV